MIDFRSLPDGIRKIDCITSNKGKYEEDKEMRIMRQRVHRQQRNAEVLLRRLCRGSEEGEKEKTG